MSKLQRLRDNIKAIKRALLNEWSVDDFEGMDKVMRSYTGFGGMNFILNGEDKAEWSKSDMMYYDDTMKLHEVLHKVSTSDADYKRWWTSLKSSVLTAFFTPRELVDGIMRSLANCKLEIKHYLDPAAGSGVFLDNFLDWTDWKDYDVEKSVAYEKDLLTGSILKDWLEDDDVEVRIDGFENFPSDELGTYDLVSTNVPFGDFRVFDPAYSNSKSGVRRDAARYIHRYYVLKGLDTLHDGGIEAFIITSNYLNNDGVQIVEAIKHARLIGAYRFANNLFKDNGTEVGTDLLVLQKDVNKVGMTADESFLITQYEQDGCPTNLYFQMHADHVIATTVKTDTDAYGKPGFVYNHEGGVQGIANDLRKVLSADLKANVDVKLFNDGKKNMKNTTTSNAQSAKRTERKAEKKNDDTEKRKEALNHIYDAYKQLYEYESTWQQEAVDGRKKLNKFYDAFVKQYGFINTRTNKAIAKLLDKGDELLALEVSDNGTWKKADIFFKPVAFSTQEIHDAGTPQEALAQSLNDYGKPNMEIMEALTGMTEHELLEKLDGEVYYNPITGEYEITAKFISGNVIEKIEKIRKKYHIPDDATSDNGKQEIAKLNIDPRVMKSLQALEDAVPAPIPFEELDFNLGERWISCKLYSEFGSYFFSMPESERKYDYETMDVNVTVNYDSILDQFAATCDNYNEKIDSQYHVESECSEYFGIQLFVYALENTCPKMWKYRRDDMGRKIENASGNYLKDEDAEATQMANTKIEEIRNGWVDWLTQQPKSVKDELAKTYNHKFNCFVKPKYDGSHQKFPGLNWKGLNEKYGVKDLYQSQKDCIWMLVQNGGGICDHEVGSGKTMIMCIAAHEMKRLGLVHKPMIIGLKANVGAIAETYQTCYPQAKVLFATSHDVNGKDRVNFFNRMKNNDYDCIIMSHDSFSKLPQSREVQEDVINNELDQLEEAMRIADGYDWANSQALKKGLERRKRNLKAKLEKLQYDINEKTDDVVDFQKMGIDHIFVDESHMFKNLGFTTRHDRVAGLGNTKGSNRAYNLLVAIRTIQQRTGKDLGATFLSGTTVTNSLTELYSLFRYLRPQALEKQGITCFDAWAAIFTKKSTEFEFSLTNQIILKERFRYFIKVPELAQFYNEITDFRTAEDVGIERPKKHARLLNIEPTPDQAEYIQTLMEFAKTGDFKLIGMPFATKEQERAKMLYATDLARKMSLDMRMIDDSYQDHPRSKSSMCARLIKQYYDKYNAVKGTQLVFSDLGAYGGKGFCVYSDIKRKLVEMGIPASEIRFIQECKNDKQKQQMIDDTNEGKIRVLFGSTQTLGTGVNCQKRVICVHHLDTPWRPSDLEQRDGRAIRKGNVIAKEYADNTVDVIIYAVRRSLDAYKFGLLNNKQMFISQLKRGQLNIRTLDEGAMDEKSGMNFAEYMAVLSGNTDLLERAKLEKRIAAMEAERKTFYREKAEQERKKERMQHEVENFTRDINDATVDLNAFNAKAQKTEDGDVMNDIVIDGFTPKSEDAEERIVEIGKEMLRLDKVVRTGGAYRKVGSVYGFDLTVKTTYLEGSYINEFFVSGERLMYPINSRGYNHGQVNRTSPRITAEMPVMELQRIAGMIDGWQKKIADNKSRIDQLDAIIAMQWGKDNDLAKLRSDLSALDLKINQSLKKDKDEDYGKAA